MASLYTGHMLWPTTYEAEAYPKLEQNLETEVAIVGGGMSGVLCGYWLALNGVATVIIEHDTIAGGSSSANTGLLQFCNDAMLVDLAEQIGERQASLFYHSCLEAVQQLGMLARKLPGEAEFRSRSSLYYASSEQDLPKHRREYEALLKHGLPVEWWDSDKITRHFGFKKPGAIVTHGDAEVNPLQFIQGIAKLAVAQGMQIYEQTEATHCSRDNSGRLCLETGDGFQVHARSIIYAIGYEPKPLHGRLSKAELNRSFVAVTPPGQPLESWHERMLIWETDRPYLYMRTTVQDRVIIGGLDEDPSEPVTSAEALGKRTASLLQRLKSHFPTMPDEAEFAWCGTFGESCDGLPFIGADPEEKGVYYCLGYGGNGTVYSMMAAPLLHSLITGKDHPLAEVVSLSRASLVHADSQAT